jgi:hypothetical protein
MLLVLHDPPIPVEVEQWCTRPPLFVIIFFKCIFVFFRALTNIVHKEIGWTIRPYVYMEPTFENQARNPSPSARFDLVLKRKFRIIKK